MLIEFGRDIWISDGPNVMGAMGFHYPTRMVVVKLTSGGLWICSPVRLDEKTESDIRDLGLVEHIVAPNSLHHVFVTDWSSRFPEASIWAVEDLQKTRPDLTPDGLLTDSAPQVWRSEMNQVVLKNRLTTEAVFFHNKSRTVIFTDLLQQLPRDWYRGWRAWVARLDLMNEASPTVPRKFRLGFQDRRAARQKIDQMLDWPCDKVLMAHGDPVTRDGHACIRSAFHWLKA